VEHTRKKIDISSDRSHPIIQIRRGKSLLLYLLRISLIYLSEFVVTVSRPALMCIDLLIYQKLCHPITFARGPFKYSYHGFKKSINDMNKRKTTQIEF
jgi:hypothetical protein